MNRRTFIQHAVAATGAVLLAPSLLQANEEALGEPGIKIPFSEHYAKLTEGKTVKESGVTLNIPDAPETGAMVPVEVSVDHPMEEGNYISQIHVMATENLVSPIITANYTPKNGKATLFINAKLGKTQDIVVLAQSSRGTIYKAQKHVKIALGGCG